MGQIFSRFFGGVFCTFSALGFLEGLLGGLWAQKRVKTHGFLRVLKRLFKAPDGPLGLILVSLVFVFGFCAKTLVHFVLHFCSCILLMLAYVDFNIKKTKKKMDNFWFLF